MVTVFIRFLGRLVDWVRRSVWRPGRWLASAALLGVLLGALLFPLMARSADAPVLDFKISAQSLASVLRELAERHQLQIVFSPGDVAGIKTPALQGRFTVSQAMTHLLAGSPLTYTFNGRDTVVIKRRRSIDGAVLSESDRIGPPQKIGLEEIIVTSERRQASLQKTFIALTAFNEQDLERFRIANVMDLANQVPGVTIVPFAGSKAAPNLFIRGMGNLDAQATKDNAVGIYMDGVPVGRGTGLAADIADLERVEVLRGPQGTLYGRNTTAGAINFISHKPDPQVAFEQQLTWGSYGLFATRTQLNLPLSDRLFTRLAYSHSSNRGWVKNTNDTLPDQVNFNQEQKQAARWALRFLASDRLTVDYSLDHSDLQYGNAFHQIMEGNPTPTGRQEQAAAAMGLPGSNAEIVGSTLTLALALDRLTLKSITAYRTLSSTVNQNYIDFFTQRDVLHQRQTSQEFQLVGAVSDYRLDYVAGMFLYREQARGGVSSSFGPGLSDTWSIRTSSDSTAVYGQIKWQPFLFDERLRITLGARETQDDRVAAKTFINSSFDPGADGTVVQGNKRFRKFTPAFTADYDFSDEISGYVKVTNGYRAGGFSTRSSLASFAPSFNPERVRAHEVGIKSESFERRLRLNLAAFTNHFHNLQADQGRVPSFFVDTLNAAKAKVSGVEVEMVAAFDQGFKANLFYAYLNGRYETYMDNGIDQAAFRYMPNTPRHQGGVGLQYDFRPSTYGKVTFNLDYRWQSDFYAGPTAQTGSAGYGLWNARLQLATLPLEVGRLRIALWGKNLADKNYRLATIYLGTLSAQFGEPRTLGLDLIYEY